MSYCRFSSDCYKSDVYVYESVHDVFVIEVAGRRYESQKPRPTYPKDGTVEQLVAYHKACQSWVRSADLVPIGLPNDGAHLEAGDAEDAAATLTRLRELGYHVPAGVIEALLDEVREDCVSDFSTLEQCLLTCAAPESVWRPALESIQSDLHQARMDNVSAFDLLSRVRMALGDNGKRMQDELIEYCRELAGRKP